MTDKKVATRTVKTAKPAAAKPAAAKPVVTQPVEAIETIEAAVAAGKETVETVVKAGTDAAQQGVDKAVAMSKEQVNVAAEAGNEVIKSYEEAVGFSKESIDAVVAANVSLVKGLQALNAQIFGLAKVSLEKNAEATKQIFACKTPEEFFALQNDIVKANYDDVVVEFQKISELTTKVAEESVAPITKQVNDAVEKFTKQLAA